MKWNIVADSSIDLFTLETPQEGIAFHTVPFIITVGDQDYVDDPHPLSGKYKGCLECHINGDFLLIWYDKNSDIIELVRLGSHSELFR